MKILYGIQGTGNGHVTRSTQIIERLKKKEIDVDVIFSGCGPNKFFDRSVIPRATFFKGFTFSIKNGRIRYYDTAKNISLTRFKTDINSFDAAGYDLVITDFEPVSAGIAKKNRLPCIGIGNQYAFAHKIPMNRFNLFARSVLKHFAPADTALGMHWHHFDQPIIPPVISDNVKPASAADKRLILVYLPFDDPDTLRNFLYPFHSYTFAVYTADRNREIKSDHNIIWHPFSKTTFYTDLSRCAGVICNAGFELPGEALFLGKKLLVKPIHGQFEQSANAKALNLLGYGSVITRLDKPFLARWLSDAPGIKRTYPDVSGQISEWISAGKWDDTTKLVQACWQSDS